MNDDQHDPDDPDDLPPGTVHLHRLAQRDDMHRLRVLLSYLYAHQHDDWRDDLTEALLLEAIHITTCACKIEVTSGDEW